jgi:hypothetical protein
MTKSHKSLVMFMAAVATAATFSRAGYESSQSSFSSISSSCSCAFVGRKEYQLFDETKNLFGHRKVHRKWTCYYSCDAGRGPETVIGSYEMTNTGEDNGLEGICEGTIYKSEFNQYVMREVYMYKDTRSFNPVKAKANEVKEWAEKQGCQ